MNQIQRKRLQKMSEFLKKGDFNGIKSFYFGNYVCAVVKEDGHVCGSAACAIGMLPLAFPDVFSYYFDEGRATGLVMEDIPYMAWGAYHIDRFFGISPSEYRLLFIPGNADGLKNIVGTKRLEDQATPTQVAENIDIFLEWKGSSGEVWYKFKTWLSNLW